MAAGQAFADSPAQINEYDGYFFEDGGFPPSAANDSLIGVARVVQTYFPFDIDLVAAEVTWVVQGLRSKGQVDIGDALVVDYFNGGRVNFYRDPAKNSNYGTNPSATPPTFTDGALVLTGIMSATRIVYGDDNTGTFFSAVGFDGGSYVDSLEVPGGFIVGTVYGPGHPGGATIPAGYDLRIDGFTLVTCSAPNTLVGDIVDDAAMPIPNVQVNLFTVSEDAGGGEILTPHSTVFTNASGAYTFTGLPSNSYRAIVVAPTGYTPGPGMQFSFGPTCGTNHVHDVTLARTPPIAICTDVTVGADAPTCASANASINAGSYDPDGENISLVQIPPGPYPVGTTQVTLQVTDVKGAVATCIANVTVQSGPGSISGTALDQAQASVAGVNATLYRTNISNTLINALFNSNAEGFGYLDDAFRGTIQPTYASGVYVSSGGFTTGALQVSIGGINNNDILNMSGGWQISFTATGVSTTQISFRYNLTQGQDYDADEYSEVLLSLDGALIGTAPNDYIARITGNGNGGGSISTGWQLFSANLGALPAGNHTLRIGGYNNKKTDAPEATTILVDNVLLTESGDQLIGNQVTGAGGTYAFPGLQSNGQFRLQLSIPPEYTTTTPLIQNHTIGCGTNIVANVALTCVTPNTMSGTVTDDAPAALNGVRVDLYVVGPDSVLTLDETVFTNASGAFSFSGLGANVYRLVVTSPTGYTPGASAQHQFGPPTCGTDYVHNVTLTRTPPVALAMNVTVGSDGPACTSGNASIDAGSYDPDGEQISLQQIPPGPYPVGTTAVQLRVTDSKGAIATANANVTVQNGPNSISGLVEDDAGSPIAGVGFTLHKVPNPGKPGMPQAAADVTVVNATFPSDAQGFTYLDDAFNGTAQPTWASGAWGAGFGFSGGGVRVVLGGINNDDILNMSGGWAITFTSLGVGAVQLSFRYNLTQTAEYENDEFSDALMSLDGSLIGTPPNTYLARITGNGSGGVPLTTGWQQFSVNLGTLAPGNHTLRIGGFNNKKTDANESTTINIDDVLIVEPNELLMGNQTTAGAGTYSFTGLPTNGTYRLQLSIPAGYTTTTPATQYFTVGCGSNVVEDVPLVRIPPVAVCQNVTLPAGPGCTPVAASINNGSYDPNSESIQIAQFPPGPYAPGETQVLLVVTDSKGASDSCTSTVTVQGDPAGTPGAIATDFNATPIAAGSTIWFNGVLTISGATVSPATVVCKNASVSFTAGGTPYTIDLPNARVVVSQSALAAATSYDAVDSTWATVLPWGLQTQSAFLTGAAFTVPANFPGGISNVTWNIQLNASHTNLGAQWRWGAAVYSTFAPGLDALVVKATDSDTASVFLNADLAGTPENYKAALVAGALGNGGTNYTGTHTSPAVLPAPLSGLGPCYQAQPDVTPPLAPSVSSPTHTTGAWSVANLITASWSGASDASGIGGYSFVWDTINNTAPDFTVETLAGSTTSPVLADGQAHWFHVRTADVWGNWGATVHLGPFWVDATAPGSPPTFVPNPEINTWVNANNLLIAWGSAADALSGVSGYSFVFDADSTTVPDLTLDTSSLTTSATGVPEGLRWFHIRARDVAGNWGAAAHHGPWRIDRTAPSDPDSIVSVPQAGVWSAADTLLTDWFGAADVLSGVAGYSIAFDQAPATVPDNTLDTAAASALYTPVPEGDTWFHVRSVDQAGNWSAGVHHGPFRIDRLPPTPPSGFASSHQDSGWSNDATVQVSWNGASDPSGIGGYSFVWDEVDSTAADTVVDTPDSSAVSPVLADGTDHWFHLRTVDGLGNWSATQHFGPFWIDTVLPTAPESLSALPLLLTWMNADTLSATWDPATDAHSGVGGYSYVFDAVNNTVPDETQDTAGTSALALGPPEGETWFHVRARDVAGNWGAAAHMGPWRIDRTPPAEPDSFATMPPVLVWSGADTLQVDWFGATDALSGLTGYSFVFDQVQSTVPDATIDTAGGSALYTPVPEGETWFHLRSVDQAGNWSAGVHVGPFRIDRFPPVPPSQFASTPADSTWTNASVIHAAWSGASDASGIGGYSFVWDQADSTEADTVIDTTADSTSSPVLADGTNHWFHLRTVDELGNWSGTQHFGPFWIDTTPPQNPATVLADRPASVLSNDNTIVTGWPAGADTLGPAQSGVAGYSWVWDHAPATVPDASADGATTSAEVTVPDGLDLYFHLRTVDVAGNVSTMTRHIGPYWVDATPPRNPTAFVSSPLVDVWTQDDSLVVAWSGHGDSLSGVSGFSFDFDMQPISPPDLVVDTTDSTATAVAPEGSSWFHLRVRDGAGNWSAPALCGPLRVDRSLPAASVLRPDGGEVFNVGTQEIIAWHAADAVSGVQSVTILKSMDNGQTYPDTIAVVNTPDSTYAWTVPTTPSDSVLVRIVVRDRAGNVREDTSAQVFRIFDESTDAPPGLAITRFALQQNEPNPFNPQTTIRFDVPRTAHVRLFVYDTAGRLVRRLADELFTGPERYAVVWDGTDEGRRRVASGVYYYALQAPGFSQTRRMIVIK